MQGGRACLLEPHILAYATTRSERLVGLNFANHDNCKLNHDPEHLLTYPTITFIDYNPNKGCALSVLVQEETQELEHQGLANQSVPAKG